MNQVITLTATIHDRQALTDFFEFAPIYLPQATFVILDPSAQPCDEEMISLLESCTTLPIIAADIDLATREQGIYVVSLQKNVLLGNGFFVSHNSIAQKAMPFADAFWHSIARLHTDKAVAVVLSPQLSGTTGIEAVKQAGGLLVCHLDPNSDRSSLYSSLFDMLLPAAQLPAAIAACLQTTHQHDRTTSLSDDTIYVAYPASDEGNHQDDFDDLLQHLRTAVLYLRSDLSIRQFSNFIQHYLSLDNSAVGKSIYQVNTDFLSPDFKTWVVAVAQQRVPIHRDIALPNGEWCDLKIVPVYHQHSNAFKGIMISITDTTGIMRVQRILDSLSQQMQYQGKAYWEERDNAQQATLSNQQAIMDRDQQRELLSNIAQTMHEGIIALHPNHTIALINIAAQTMTGLSSNQSIRQWIETHYFFLPDDEQIAIPNDQNPIIRTLQGSYTGDADIDLYVIPKNGTQEGIFISIHTQALSNTTQQEKGTLVILRNITDRKQSELELQDSELRQKALLFAIPDSMFHLNKDGEYLEYMPAKNINKQSEVFFRYEPAFFIGNRIQDTLPEIGNEIMAMFEQAIQTGEVQTHAFESPETEWVRHYDIRLSLVNHREALVLIRDITDIIAGRHLADKYADYYYSLIEACPMPIVWIDQQAKVVHANAKINNLGLNAQSIIGSDFYNFLPHNEVLRARTALENAFKNAAQTIGKYKIVLPNGETIAVKTKASIINFNRKRLLQVMLGTQKKSKS